MIMTSRIQSFVLAMVLLGGNAFPETVDEVIARHIEALGGARNLKAVKTLRLTGSVTPRPGVTVKLVVEKKRPGKLRVEFTPPGGPSGSEGYDGSVAWESNPFDDAPDPTQLSGAAETALRRAADFDGPLVDYREQGHRVELLGKEATDNREFYHLKVTRDDATEVDYYLDEQTCLAAKTFEIRSIHAGEPRPTTTVFSDYRRIAGLTFAFQLEETAPGGHREIVRWDRIETNVALPDTRFQMPSGGD